MAKVFLSHASGEVALTHKVHRWLAEEGHEVFQYQHPRDGILIGEDWEQRLYERLRWADAVVCLVTSAYLTSMWCTAEVGAARARGIRLLPLCAGPRLIHPLLTSTQHIDLDPDRAAARATLVEALRRVDASWPEDRSPFPGLRPFDTDQHRVFFGRAEEAGQLAGLLRSPAEHANGAVLLVVGPSGCGKSSLVRAGLLPVMADEPGWWTLPPILPGADPVRALARELAVAARQAGLNRTVAQVRDQLDYGGLSGLAEELLLAAPDGPRRHLLVVVDQFEELLTQTAPAQRARVAELLRSALIGPVHLVATLRSEFLDQLLLDPHLAVLPMHTYTLRPLGREALRAVIEKPAKLAGIDLDDGLAARLAEDTSSGEALPLLAFTLAQLAEGITRGGRLSGARYDQLGGVQGALIRQADAALAHALTTGGRSRDEVIAGLLRLVTVDEQGRPTRWRIDRAELPDHVVTELDAFVARRLLTTDTDNGTVVLGVAHEAFLSAWPPLAEAISANVTALRARRTVEHAAAEWHDHDRPPTRLWSGGQLAAAVTDTGARIRRGSAPPPPQRRHWLPRRHRILVTNRVDLNPAARDFLHASIRHDRSRRRRATTVLSVLLILALVGAGVAVFQQLTAQQEQRIATARQLIAQANSTMESDPRTALKLGIAAQRIHPSAEAQSSLVNSLTVTHYAGSLTGHTGPVFSVAFSPDGHIMATGGNNIVILWDLTNPTQPHRLGQPLTSHTGRVFSVAFAPDGHTLATGGGDRVILWDLTNPTQPHPLGQPLTGHSGPVAFSHDGQTLATGSNNNTVTLWDVTNRLQPNPLGRPLTGHTDEVTSVAFAPDGHTLATGGNDDNVILWDLTNPIQPHPLLLSSVEHIGGVSSVAFTPDGNTLATSGGDGRVILWDDTNRLQPGLLKSLTGSSGTVSSVAFSPDGNTLATGSDDKTITLWDVKNRMQPHQLGRPLTGHTRAVNSVAFAPDGHTLATGSDDGAVIRWDLTNPTQPHQSLTGHTDDLGIVVSAAFAPDGHTLASGGYDGTVILWDLTNPAQPHLLGQPLTDHTGPVDSVAFAPDGHTLATGGSDNTTILWDLTNPTQPHQSLTGHTGPVTSVAFAPDGHTLATASHDGTVILWDLTNPVQPHRLGQPLDHTSAVFSVAFAPDGHTLATASYDSTVILWDLTVLNSLRNHAAERACVITQGGLNREEWDRFIPGLPYQSTCTA